MVSARTSATESIRLRLQSLSGPMQVLAVGALAALRSGGDSFVTKDVSDLMADLRLPAAANISATLGRLRGQSLVMRPTKDAWALTPKGEAKLHHDAAHVPTNTLAVQLGDAPGSELGEREHTLIPPFLGPKGAAKGLSRLLDQKSFEQNVMLITAFPKGTDDPFSDLIDKMRAAVSDHGLNLVVASDAMLEDTLWANVVTYMWAAKYAIVLMNTADNRLNYNVLIEIGGMLMTGRRCAILRDITVPEMPTDLVGHIYKPTDLSDHAASLAEIHKWIRDDLGLGQCANCPSVSSALALVEKEG